MACFRCIAKAGTTTLATAAVWGIIKQTVGTFTTTSYTGPGYSIYRDGVILTGSAPQNDDVYTEIPNFADEYDIGHYETIDGERTYVIDRWGTKIIKATLTSVVPYDVHANLDKAGLPWTYLVEASGADIFSNGEFEAGTGLVTHQYGGADGKKYTLKYYTTVYGIFGAEIFSPNRDNAVRFDEHKSYMFNDLIEASERNDTVFTPATQARYDDWGFDRSRLSLLGGDDILDASKSPGLVAVFGGLGKDTITGSNFGDFLDAGLAKVALDLGSIGEFSWGAVIDYVSELDPEDASSNTVSAGSGDDFVFGGDGSDSLKGEGGNDLIIGYDGKDELDGGDGHDLLVGGGSMDAILGGKGNDWLFGDGWGLATDADTFTGGQGDDFILGGLLPDNVDMSDLAAITPGGILPVLPMQYVRVDDKDVAIYSGSLSSYRITELAGGYLQVKDMRSISTGDGTDVLSGIDTLKFADKTVRATGHQTVTVVSPSDAWQAAMVKAAGSTRWANDKGTASAAETTTITYSFVKSAGTLSSDYQSFFDGQSWVSAAHTAMKTAVGKLVGYLESVTRIDFVEVIEGATESAIGKSPVGTIRFSGFTDFPGSTLGVGRFPLREQTDMRSMAGDLYLDTALQASSFNPGTKGFSTLAHEFLHTLGMGHIYPATSAPAAAPQSIMEPILGHVGDSKPYTGFQPVDIDTIQYLYGKNTASSAGNTVWKAVGTIDGFDDAYRASETIFDASGNDTLDFSTLTAKAALIDLKPGAISYVVEPGTIFKAQGTLGLTNGTIIENAFGGAQGDVIFGNDQANTLRGYDGDDTISGRAGNDKISGGRGNDILAGNAGADTYYFSYGLNGTTNVDTIKGYSGIDLISLSSAIFTKAGPVGALAPSAFVANTTGKALDASDRIVCETDTGILRYDPDGTGAAAATAFAKMDGLPSMNAGDFVIA